MSSERKSLKGDGEVDIYLCLESYGCSIPFPFLDLPELLVLSPVAVPGETQDYKICQISVTRIYLGDLWDKDSWISSQKSSSFYFHSCTGEKFICSFAFFLKGLSHLL